MREWMEIRDQSKDKKREGTGERIFASNLQLYGEEEDRMERQSRAEQDSRSGQVRSGWGKAESRVEGTECQGLGTMDLSVVCGSVVWE